MRLCAHSKVCSGIVAVVIEWPRFYNHQRRHSAAGMKFTNDYENTALIREAA